MEKHFNSKIGSLWMLSLLINIITFCLIYFKIRPTGGTVALHYNVLVGVDTYGKARELYVIPAIAAILTLINYILYRFTRNGKYTLPILNVFVTLVVQLSLFLATLFLSRVN